MKDPRVVVGRLAKRALARPRLERRDAQRERDGPAEQPVIAQPPANSFREPEQR